mgnify:CR=1 FL=1
MNTEKEKDHYYLQTSYDGPPMIKENEEYIHSQARGMDLCRTYVDLGTAIEKDKIIDLHYLSDEHLKILTRSVAKENEKRQ